MPGGWDTLIASFVQPEPQRRRGGGKVSADYVRQGLIARGVPDYVADGFLPNIDDESGFDPGINEAAPTVAGSRGGFGLNQWTGPRRRALEAFAAQRGTSPADVDTQLDFTVYELNGPEKRAYERAVAAGNARGAAAAIVNDFLRPAEAHRARRAAKYLGSDYSAGPSAPARPEPSYARLWLDLGST